MIIGFEKCDEWEYNNRKIKRYHAISGKYYLPIYYEVGC